MIMARAYDGEAVHVMSKPLPATKAEIHAVRRRMIAQMYLAGSTIPEIAGIIGRTERRVYQELKAWNPNYAALRRTQ